MISVEYRKVAPIIKGGVCLKSAVQASRRPKDRKPTPFSTWNGYTFFDLERVHNARFGLQRDQDGQSTDWEWLRELIPKKDLDSKNCDHIEADKLDMNPHYPRKNPALL